MISATLKQLRSDNVRDSKAKQHVISQKKST